MGSPVRIGISPGWLAFLWLGALVAVVVAGVAGRTVDEPRSTPPPTPPPATAQPTPDIVLIEPRYDAALFTWSPIRVSGQARGARFLRVTIAVDGVVIGETSLVPDPAGSFAASVPVLPPALGGWATVTVTTGSGSAAVRVGLEPSGALLVWVPEPHSAPIVGNRVDVVGHAQWTVGVVHLALSPADAGPFSEVETPPAAVGGGSWRRFTASLEVPAGTPCGNVVLAVTARGPGGEALGRLEVPLALSPDASTCRP